MRYFVDITSSKLSLDTCYDFIKSEACGGNCIFIGSVRNKSQGKSVVQLDFESYDAMAQKEMLQIVKTALNQFEIEKVYLVHAKGELQISDIAVIIGVSSKHRKASFDACQFVIDTLKEKVPIWKKEHFSDGMHWVNALP